MLGGVGRESLERQKILDQVRGDLRIPPRPELVEVRRAQIRFVEGGQQLRLGHFFEVLGESRHVPAGRVERRAQADFQIGDFRGMLEKAGCLVPQRAEGEIQAVPGFIQIQYAQQDRRQRWRGFIRGSRVAVNVRASSARQNGQGACILRKVKFINQWLIGVM